ncbi:AAA family ATPase [Rhodococcus sp. RDE2]|uniref:AAA family ATPase n=1 Tax=Rhodococcus sp. RDE2 TaxID=2885078 RepID=UPI001E3B48FD|nr:AAA family ATPase [Rhodococcus sp. RDE2]BDB60128.1 hypothetical protein RDE2_19220 [Rhodococcus sp. RDE2]
MRETSSNAMDAALRGVPTAPTRWDAVKVMAKAGFSVLLVKPGTKDPLDVRSDREKANDEKAGRSGSGLHTATTNLDRLEKYWARAVEKFGVEPNVAVNVERSGLVTIDADQADETADVQRRGLEGADVPLEAYAPTVTTPGAQDAAGKWVHSGGGHFHFYVDVEDLPLVKSFKLPGGAEVSTKDRYVLIPPSVRNEGPYTVTGPVRPLSSAPWLVDLIRAQADADEADTAARAQAAQDRAQRRETEGPSSVEAWNDAHPWEELLTAYDWTPTGKPDNCGCPIVTAPGDHASPKSATAHEGGCTNRRVDLEGASGPLHIWTDHPPVELEDRERWTKAQFVAAMRHQTMEEFLVAEGLVDDEDTTDPAAMALEVPVDPIDAAVARIVAMTGSGGGTREQRRARLDGAFLSRADLRSLPPLTALVDGYLYLDTLAQLNGERGTFKTFLALDWAGSVATGTSWNGHGVHHGNVLYFAGEGVAKFDDRLSAWEMEHEVHEAPVDVFREIVDFAAEATVEAEWVYVAALLSLRERKPSLIVIDTMARYTSGHDENSAQDMGRLITNLDVLRRVTGACVLVVHHTTRGTTHGRGSTAVEGAMQSVFLMRRSTEQGRVVAELSTTKQKDSPEAEPIKFLPKEIPAAASVVLDPVVEGMDPFTAEGPSVGQHSPHYVRVAAVLWRTFGPGTSGGTKGEVRAVLQGDEDLRLEGKDRQSVSKAFYNAWAVLEKRGALVKATGSRFHLSDEAAVEFGLVEAPETDEDDGPAAGLEAVS